MYNDKPILLANDRPTLRREIRELTKRGYKVARPSPHHVKIGPVNYFPSTGTITSDPCYRHPEKGFDSLVRILEEVAQSALTLRIEGE
jgi:hypothetical protein